MSYTHYRLKMEQTSHCLLHCLCVIVLCVTVAVTREVYVRPSSTTACLSATCYTLEHILQNPSEYLFSDTRIIFLAGVYEVYTKSQAVITNVLSFIGSGSDIQMYYIYNKAGMAGSTLYGENFDTCFTLVRHPLSPVLNMFGAEFWKSFSFPNQQIRFVCCVLRTQSCLYLWKHSATVPNSRIQHHSIPWRVVHTVTNWCWSDVWSCASYCPCWAVFQPWWWRVTLTWWT